MTEPWATLRERATSLPVLSNDALLYGLLILACVGLAVGLFFFTSRVYAYLIRQPDRGEMYRFGFAFLPLALLTHIGHNLGHFFNGYALVPGALAGLVNKIPQTTAEGAPNFWLWHAMEIGLVLVGLVISMWAVRGICGAIKVSCPRQLATAPYIALAILYAAIFIVMFALPMVTRLS